MSGPFNPLGHYDKLKMAETDTFFLVEPDDRYIVSVVHPEGISPLVYAKKAKEIQKIDSKAAKWIAADAIRELESQTIQKRLKQT